VNYKETTQIPNSVFDKYIPLLKPSEVIILLIILRQTIGWYNPKTKKRKVRDWISYKQFEKKSGLSRKTISQAIHKLVQSNLVLTTDSNHNLLQTPGQRKGKVCIYYQCLLVCREKSNGSNVKKYSKHRYNLPITKLTPTKLNKQKGKSAIKKISDADRILEILEKRKHL